MKHLRKITLLALSIGILLTASSCTVLTPQRHDQGLHRGWYKQSKAKKQTVRINHGSQKQWVMKSSATKSSGKGNQGNQGNQKSKIKIHKKK